jgi:hypothetical protein
MQDSSEIKAVELTRGIRDAHAAELEGKTPEERIAFYREHALYAELGRPDEVPQDSFSRSGHTGHGR